MALSSAECELISMLATMNIGESIGPFFEELLEDDIQHHLYGDNQAACRSFEDSATNWRTRHLKIRAAAGRERVQLGTGSVMHLPGQYQLADIATKPLPGSRFLCLLQLMNVMPYDHTAIAQASPTPCAIPVGTGKRENQIAEVDRKGKEGPRQGDVSPRQNSAPEPGWKEPCAKGSSLMESSGQPVSPATRHARDEAELAVVQAGLQVRMALIAIIIASLCYPEGSRDVTILEGGNSFTHAMSLQELTAWAALFLLVVWSGRRGSGW